MLIGITGGIGGGKSTLSKVLRSKDYLVYDTDKEARRMQNEDEEMRRQIIDTFGADVYDGNVLNRPKLAAIVFGNKELLKQLTDIVHPAIKRDVNRWKAENSAHKLLFLESAILFENGLVNLTDKVILMTASEEVRIRRVMKRDQISIEQVKARMSHQIPEEEKIKRSDFIIHSDDNMPLVDKVERVLEILLKDF